MRKHDWTFASNHARFDAVILTMLLTLTAATGLAHAAAPTFQELMNPDVFPNPQRGMQVDSATVSSDALRVVTTGAQFTLNTAGKGSLRQRIGHEREIVQLQIAGVGALPKLTHTGPGFAFAQFDTPKLDLRVNGDSLFMFHAHEAVTIDVTRMINIGFYAPDESNCLILDEWGGYGLFASDPNTKFDDNVYGSKITKLTIPADGVLWIGICPPKPYDWKRSITDNVVWHWSNTLGYPKDDDLIAWSQEGNTVLLQSEVMLWKDWNLAFVPRLGEAEFARVRKTMHDHGQRFIVYTSPYYFLKGTPIESKAMNSFDHFEQTGFPPGWPDGVNIDLFMDEISKVMREYKPDGLYFDGQYMKSVPALYALARRTRALLGEDGILEWHSTTALGHGFCYLPQADAYVDFILRGEGREGNYGDFDYLRYFVSGYNASNSIGVICNNNSKPTPELMKKLLQVNARMHTIAGWLAEPAVMDVVHKDYQAHLTDALQAAVDKGVDDRQAQVAAKSEARSAELNALLAAPAWGEARLVAKADDLLKWTPSVSPLNSNAFAARDGVLAITAKASTYAFLTHPLTAPAHGFVFRMKQGTDGGMSWGPAVALRWPSGAFFRVGLRSDGSLQSDLNGEQQLFGKHDPSQWVWVRVRWLEQSGVVESSTDGAKFERVWTFSHKGMFLAEAPSILVGKVSYNCTEVDHSDVGSEGVCYVDEVRVF
ncbi:MAG: hypothetical protein K1Y02_09045 [Candidatus Hydrogenedentes bacterium]|nr:hypothetical protein [Candidatus Hydrogenedentota bacterium]